ncbi:endolytic transglycosylase MltG [Alkalimarinus sediminis]|uniref:Endolytic murein transglycosylase n=1 Tax=Alkalimarinus sediminis TaxID=1632866 RepID=A0A9E8KRK2_9ALTE|nr:endolytic transglycosylase MltG [Alkalimarinus sediminis]UZW76475.1 endolytic transglycosylase MltG [Alkalimarinus sediminis]
MNKLITVLVALALLLSLSAISVGAYYYHKLNEPVIGEGEVTVVEIRTGQSFNAITQLLLSEGVLETPWIMKAYGRVSGLSAKLKAGEYRLEGPLTIPQVVELFVSGNSISYQITLVEGWTFKDILKELSRHEKLKKVISERAPLDILKAVTDEYQHPEGLFFPDTYTYRKNDTDLSILVRSYNRMQKVLQAEWALRDKSVPLASPYEALILASIVEKETGDASERAQIAGVFVRRINKGMRLQTDPTVIYGLGDKYKGNITRAHLKQYTPYNTYRINGLPPTPIALAGREAIHATLHPDSSKTLYFVAKGNGQHYFSETLKEHVNAVNKYQIYKREKNYRSTK